MEQSYAEPVYTIGITAKLINVCHDTLRIWERKGLIKPKRLGKNRFYSQCDIDHLKHIKGLIRGKKVNIQGVKNILSIRKCWELKECKPKDRSACLVYRKLSRA